MFKTSFFIQKSRLFLSLFSLFTLIVCSCKSHENKAWPTARQIIEKYLEAAGGIAKLKAVRSLRVEGIIAIPNATYAETIYLYEPGKTCLITKSMDGSVSKIIYNNGRAVEISNGEPTLITDSLALERMKLFGYLQAEVGYIEEHYNLTLVNTEQMNNRLNYRIKVISPLGAVDYKLYDAETGQLTLLADAEGYKTTYSQYDTQDGLTFPLMQQSISKTGRVMNIQLQKRIVNKRIDPELFEF